MLHRRKSDPAMDPIREAFGRVATLVEVAQRGLLASIPTARDPGVPLAQGLAEFGRRLVQAEARMPGWRDDRVAEAWQRCHEALRAARRAAEALRLEPLELGFELLNQRVGDVLHPLEVFADAERELRRR